MGKGSSVEQSDVRSGVIEVVVHINYCFML